MLGKPQSRLRGAAVNAPTQTEGCCGVCPNADWRVPWCMPQSRLRGAAVNAPTQTEGCCGVCPEAD